MARLFRWLFGLPQPLTDEPRPAMAWVILSGGDAKWCPVIKHKGGLTLAKVYGGWKVVGVSYVERVLEE